MGAAQRRRFAGAADPGAGRCDDRRCRVGARLMPQLSANRSAGVRSDVVATVRVPATSANLGPGFDSLGLALAIHDVVRLRVAPSGFEVTVRGEGAGSVSLT